MIRGLRTAAMGVFAWAALAVPPQRPSDLEAENAIEKSRQVALDYARSLPDFVCTEVVSRYTDFQHRGGWLPQDMLTVKLSYFEQKEDHKLTQIDGKPTDRTYDSLGGAIGVGEFGGTLHTIFDPKSAAVFHWESWKNVRRRRAAVYSYVVPPGHSSYLLVTGTSGNLQQAVVGFHGTLEIDNDTGAVVHFTYQADNIPKPLLLDYARSTVDYDFADVGGRDYLLPAHSETEMRSPRVWMRNVMEFRHYSKFSTESTITFDPGK
jgi:hypothetical protein